MVSSRRMVVTLLRASTHRIHGAARCHRSIGPALPAFLRSPCTTISMPVPPIHCTTHRSATAASLSQSATRHTLTLQPVRSPSAKARHIATPSHAHGPFAPIPFPVVLLCLSSLYLLCDSSLCLTLSTCRNLSPLAPVALPCILRLSRSPPAVPAPAAGSLPLSPSRRPPPPLSSTPRAIRWRGQPSQR